MSLAKVAEVTSGVQGLAEQSGPSRFQQPQSLLAANVGRCDGVGQGVGGRVGGQPGELADHMLLIGAFELPGAHLRQQPDRGFQESAGSRGIRRDQPGGLVRRTDPLGWSSHHTPSRLFIGVHRFISVRRMPALFKPDLPRDAEVRETRGPCGVVGRSGPYGLPEGADRLVQICRATTVRVPRLQGDAEVGQPGCARGMVGWGAVHGELLDGEGFLQI
ncbi:hypothetical protein [Acrocarpospora sp. B8E8]|uniref:hypothetical protein n=1 Tax=Acrocarpospora sp. B8E8 TaxID=3153572 RepID=UPI00325C8435